MDIELERLHAVCDELDEITIERDRYKNALIWIMGACPADCGRCYACGKPTGIEAIRRHAERALCNWSYVTDLESRIDQLNQQVAALQSGDDENATN